MWESIAEIVRGVVVIVLGAGVLALCNRLFRQITRSRWTAIALHLVAYGVSAVVAVLLSMFLVFGSYTGPALTVQTQVPAAARQIQEPPQEPAAARQIQEPTKAKRTYKFFDRNSHCAGDRTVEWYVAATEGWMIDIHSIEDANSATQKSVYKGVQDKSKDGFYVRGRLGNDGSCVKAFGAIIAKDARGELSVSGTYTEIRDVAVSDQP